MAPTPTPVGATAPAATKAPKERKKPGNKGDFHGAREEFLVSQLPGYLAASKISKTRDFWPALFKDWFQRFDWRLDLGDEPAPTDLWLPDSKITTEEFIEKGKRQNKLKEVGAGPLRRELSLRMSPENKDVV